MKVRIAVLVSGGGTNLQALIDAQKSGLIKSGEIALVISNVRDAYALERAGKAGIEAVSIVREEHISRTEFERAMLERINAAGIGLIVLAGFLYVLSADFISAFNGPIINVHPSLIPSFCGDGFYGLKVHEEALKYGVKVSGATVHFVNEITDGGKIIFQKAVEVKQDDTPESLQKRVMEEAEWVLLPRAAEKICAEIGEKNEL